MDSTSGQRRVTRGSRPLACVMLLAGLTVSGSSLQGSNRDKQPSQPTLLDLRQAVIVGPASPTLQEQTALRVLVEEVEKRTLIKLPLSTEVKGGIGSRPVIAVGTAASLKGRAGDIPGGLPAVAAPGPEGYVLQTGTRGNQPVVTVAGADARGMLFGVGRLLRELRMGKGAMGNAVTYEPRLQIASGLRIATAPKVEVRGHQLGYRPKTNSYDGWDVAQWEQYIRDLAIFGTNAVELIPPSLGRCGGQSAFSASADRHGDRDVAHPRRLRSRRLALVSRAREGLRVRGQRRQGGAATGPPC